MSVQTFTELPALAQHLRDELEKKKFFLLYAHNSVGKTRLSTAFKDLGKQVNADGELTARDTLYFNAFTEDLFGWHNDLDNDIERFLRINGDSRFFDGLESMEMDNRIRPFLSRYADFDFRIDTNKWVVRFSREVSQGDGHRREDDIKVSRGEENIFIWCFFLAIVQLVLDGAEPYEWVEYVYIDDPISSLDENNAIAVGNHLAAMLTGSDNAPKTIVSTHHPLFFNVLCNELRKKAHQHLLTRGAGPNSYVLNDTTSRPFLNHLATLVDLNLAQAEGKLYAHHFNMLRRVMEQTANFFGMDAWKNCIQPEPEDTDETLYKRVIDIMSHGDYSLFEPTEMMDENKDLFRKVFSQFIANHPFNPALFLSEPAESSTS
jgi:hypothetical protein